MTEEQAVKTLAILKDFIDKEKLDPDWGKLFSGNYSHFKDTVSSIWSKVPEKAEDYGSKIGDTVEDLADKAKDKIKDISKDKEGKE